MLTDGKQVNGEGEVPGLESEAGRGTDFDTNDEATSDREWVLQVRSGEIGSFDRIVERYTARLFTHLYRMVRNREEAEDLTQETFLRAYRALGQLDLARPLRNWLYTIATHTALNAMRTQRRRGVPIRLDDMDRAADLNRGSMPEPAARDEDIRQQAGREELQQRVAAAVRRLPARSAALIHLHYHEGLSIREASEIAGVTESAAKVALFRARQHLRKWLVDGEDSPDVSEREEES